MIVVTEGHRYIVKTFENNDMPQTIQFIHKESITKETHPEYWEHGENPKEGTLHTVSDGITNEDLLEVLINRMQYLQSKFPCRENAIVITNLEESLMWLNKRTEDRKKRNVEGKHLK